jgi:hypothetical protein
MLQTISVRFALIDGLLEVSSTDVDYNLWVLGDTARVTQPDGGMLSMMPESDNCLANASHERTEPVRVEEVSPGSGPSATPG